MELIFYILAGAGVGFAVGMTGVGGGSLMTPLLIIWGVPTKIAIGTDLLYAAVTKSGAMIAHQRQGTIRWRLVFTLALGSIPASITTTYALRYLFGDFDYAPILNKSLGFMLIVTAIVIVLRKRLLGEHDSSHHQDYSWFHRHALSVTFVAGMLLGVVVTLSSVGAGAFCAALLLILYPRLPALHIIGTDIAHAVPLTLIAGLGHFWNDNIDFGLLFGLLIGSVPAVHFGSKLAARVPNSILQPILAVLLLIIGVKFAFFGSSH